MSEVKEVKAITLKATTEELAGVIKKHIKIDPKTGVGKITDNWYVDNLGDALPTALVEKFPGIVEELPAIISGLQDHNTRVAAAAGYAFGQLSEKEMHKHKDLSRTELEIPTIKKDALEFTYDRTRQVPSRNADGTTGTKAAFGMLRVGYRTYGAESVGELKKVKSLLSESAASVLGG